MSRVETAVLATAPTRVDLAGGILDVLPPSLFHDPAVVVTVAIDRRTWCRVAPRSEGVRLESKDSLVRVQGASVDEVLAGDRPPLAAFVLKSLGVTTGVEVETRSRVPDGSGLGEAGAQAAAVAAAVAAATGGDVSPGELWRMARDAETLWRGWPTGARDSLTALHGGVLAVRLEPGGPRMERLAADAAAIEECLLLARAGTAGAPQPEARELQQRHVDGDPEVRRCLTVIADVARRMAEALAERRLAEVPELLWTEWEARQTLSLGGVTPEVERIADLARESGGAARPCGGGVVALWAAPGSRGAGPREALKAALKKAGVPELPFRADLQGLEVERA